jgi:hypothetical protein
MVLKHSRREAIAGMGMGIIASMFPKWIFAEEKIQLSKKIVTYLNPESILVNRGVSQKIDKASFNASGNWRLPYRIWMAIGGEQDENKGSSTLGFLIIEKNIDKSIPGRMNISVKQKILQQGGRPQFQDFQYTEAQVVCQDNDIATPMEWEIENSIWRGNAKLDYCSFTEKGQIKFNPNDIRVQIQVNNVARPDLRFEPGTGLTSDFTLIAALPKLLEAKSGLLPKQFVLLEKLRLRKENQLLLRNPDYDYTSDNFGSLHKIEHRGDGIQPFDYWLDEIGCPLFICTLHNAYIYDLKAEEKVAQICATGKRRQFED